MFKKYWPVVLSFFLVILLILAYFQKGNLNTFISKNIQRQNVKADSLSAEERIQANYNYHKNGKNYEFTFLEFSSTGCTICEQMKPVLKEVSELVSPKVNVVFMHIMKPENLVFMKYYGISAVPMQILLDDEGREFYRHYGFITSAELERKFETFLKSKS